MSTSDVLADLSPGKRRALALLLLLPRDKQQEVLSRLEQQDRDACQDLLRHAAQLNVPDLIELAIDELDRLLLRRDGTPQEAAEPASQQVQRQAGGDDEVQPQDTPTDGSQESTEEAEDSSAAETRASLGELLEELNNIEAGRLAAVLGKERPKLVSAALYYLPEEKAARVLALLPPETAKEAFVGLAEASKLPSKFVTAVLMRVLAAVRQSEETATVQPTEGPGDDRQRLVALARSLPSEKRTQFLATLKEKDPELAEYIRKNIYTINDLLRMADSCVQKILSEVELRTVALAIKNAPPELKTKIASNLSKRVRESLFEEMEMLGTVPPSKVAEAQQEILNVVLQLDEKGELVMET